MTTVLKYTDLSSSTLMTLLTIKVLSTLNLTLPMELKELPVRFSENPPGDIGDVVLEAFEVKMSDSTRPCVFRSPQIHSYE